MSDKKKPFEIVDKDFMSRIKKNIEPIKGSNLFSGRTRDEIDAEISSVMSHAFKTLADGCKNEPNSLEYAPVFVKGASDPFIQLVEFFEHLKGDLSEMEFSPFFTESQKHYLRESMNMCLGMIENLNDRIVMACDEDIE